MTNFDEIYMLNGSIQKENYSGTPDNIYYFMMSNYLTFAIGVFCEYSYIDIADYVPFEQEIYTFSTLSTETEITLVPAPPIDSELYISIDGVSLDDSEYSYDEATQTIILANGGGEVYVGAYIVGQFNNTITIKEKIILADAMSEWFTEGTVNDSSNLTQVMYAGVEFSSQANHTKANLDVEKFRNGKSFKNMLMYTYTKNMPDTINLAKRAGAFYE